MSKECTPLWRDARFQVKMYKTQHVRSLFWKFTFQMSKKCTLLWREARFRVKMFKALHVRTTFGCSDVVRGGRRKGLCTLSKVSKMWGFPSMSKNDGRRGTFVDSPCHSWFTTTNLSYRFPIFLKLPPPPCAALLVSHYNLPNLGWARWYFKLLL